MEIHQGAKPTEECVKVVYDILKYEGSDTVKVAALEVIKASLKTEPIDIRDCIFTVKGPVDQAIRMNRRRK
jgi:hypothetical protein